MKLTLTLGVVLYVIGFHGNAAKTLSGEKRDVPAFVQSLKFLQHGPPDVATKGRAGVITETIEQKLDHFDENETRTWQMRYMSNRDYFIPGRAIFIYLGGEWEIYAGAISWGHFVDMARDHNGYLFYTEHRYFGRSHPTSHSTENYKYLNIQQALADVAHFVRTIKRTKPGLENSKVIISGGSYSATMVVWFKRLYPELIDGGWASSAPLLAQVDFKEYKEVVGRAYLEKGSQACYNRIQNGIADMEYMIKYGYHEEFKDMFNLCKSFNGNNELDVWSVFGGLSNIFAGIAQYQMYDDISGTCDYLMYFKDDLTAMANYWLVMIGATGCIEASYKNTVDYYKESALYYENDRPWLFQTCNEFGWYPSSKSEKQPFGTQVPAKLYTTMCSDIFGDKFTEKFIEQQVAETNEYFGGMNPNVEDIYMTHGDLDPWNPMGLGQDEGATVIPGYSHCADFDSISYWDSLEMLASKLTLAELVRGWVNNESFNITETKSKFAKQPKPMREIVNMRQIGNRRSIVN